MGMIGDSKLINPAFFKFFKDPILILIYLAGVAWFLLLSHDSLNAKTYFSENALLPGLVDSELYSDNGASQLSDELQELLKRRRDEHNYEIPSEWLLEKFKMNGLHAYSQNYTFSYPHGVYSELNEMMKGTNVYTIIRSPRASSAEALVINVPFNNHPSTSQSTPSTNHPAIAAIISLAKAFRKKSYWAKDLVFVVTDNNEVGMNAWLSSYHHVPNQYIRAQVLPARSGVIQAALVLELQSNTNGHFNIKTEGVNGKLPNLDLFNTVERMFNKEGSRTQLLEAQDTWLYQLGVSRRWKSFVNMALMIWHLSSNYPTGNHGYFLSYGIEAVTIKGVEKRGGRQLEMIDVQRALEGILRSLNNLLERLHQSFFFYLLASPSRYISIGVYMPPIGLMLLPILIKALKLKFELSQEVEEEKAKKDGEKEKVSENESSKINEKPVGDDGTLRKRLNVAKTDKDGDDDERGSSEGKVVETERQITAEGEGGVVPSVFPLFLHSCVSVGIPVASFYSSGFFISSSRSFHVEVEDSLSICLVISHLAIIAYPFIFQWYTRKAPMLVDARHMDLFALVALGISCGILSVVNVSLSFLVLSFWIPLLLISRPVKYYRMMVFLKAFLLLLFSPLVLLGAATTANLLIANKATFPSLSAVLGNLGDGLMSSFLHYNLFSLWSFPFIYFIFLPVWALMWMAVAVPSMKAV